MFYKQDFGQNGENIAENYLKSIGYFILNRNYRCKQGEIDIIAKDGEEIVFVEVKTRSSIIYGNPAEAVDTYKQKHIRKAAEVYVYSNQLYNCYIRFDVIEVYLNRQTYRINHIKQAWDYGNT